MLTREDHLNESSESKEEEIRIVRFGKQAFGICPIGVYMFDVAGSNFQIIMPSSSFFSGSSNLLATKIGGFDLIPMGEENDYPEEVREVLDENPVLQEMINKKSQIFWGQGPALYKPQFRNGRKFRYWEDDINIKTWLQSWNWEEYLQKTIIEFHTMDGFYSKFLLNGGQRIGDHPMISQLEHVPSTIARLEWTDENGISQHIITGSFDQPWKKDLKSYPIFDSQDPFAHPVTMRYSNRYCFGLDYDYSRSPIHGLFTWAKLSASIAKLLSAFNANSMALKYHIEIPAIFWETEKEKLQQQCANEDRQFTEALFKLHQTKLMSNWTKVLSGRDNVGKFITTQSYFDDASQQNVGFKITPLDQSIQDFIKSQINIAHEALFELTAGIGLHNTLSDITIKGNLSAGSEHLYALLIYLNTSVAIPEDIICKDINAAIKVNFPASPLRIGFYHDKI